MLIGAWGEDAIGLLANAPCAAGEAPDRLGALAVLGAPGASEDAWRCWVSGRLTNAAALRQRFAAAQLGLAAPVALAHARNGPLACGLLRGTFLLVAADAKLGTAYVARDQLGGRSLSTPRSAGACSSPNTSTS